MRDKERTLTFSEQKAYEVILRLIELKMLPSYSWRAVDLGDVLDDGYDEGFGSAWKIKKR